MRDKEEKQRNEESDVKGSSSSTSSSPSHEFSFTISFHDNKEISPSSNFALDLSPADDIFFHGHLLPLHLLSHLPISPPRSSTNSNHTFTFPIKHQNQNDQDTHTPKGKTKSLFGLPKQTKLKLDHVAQVVKKYIRMARPLLSFTSKKNMQIHTPAYTYPGNLKLRGEKKLQYSAPASIRTSPTNSGLLVPKPTGTSDSTTEELQAAIQAAIAHCKKSFSMDDKVI